jgi:cardiolipin synthase A/B
VAFRDEFLQHKHDVWPTSKRMKRALYERTVERSTRTNAGEEYMTSTQEQVWSRLTSRPRHLLSLLKVAGYIIGAFLALLVSTVATLLIVDALSKRKSEETPFPRLPLDPVRLGDNDLQLYEYGRDLYDAMLGAIDNAQESIYLESYIWKDDEVGREFKHRLVQKAAQGIDVYVIFDSFANLVVPQAFKVFPPEMHVLEYQALHVIRQPWQVLDLRSYSLDHRKLLVVDGSMGFIGGYNIGSLYATEWRDTHLRVSGPAAADLANSFREFWNRACPKDEIKLRYSRTFDSSITIQENDALRLTFPIRNMYIAAINAAEHAILITNAYFVPDHHLLNALKAAAKRGVDVRVLVPWKSNHVIVDWVARGYFTDCLKAGIRVLGYNHTMLHAKTGMIDDHWLTVGTANLDRLSSLGNYEVNLEIYSPELARQMRALFESDTNDVIELTLDEWECRSWFAKMSERILAPLRALL